MDVVWGLPRCVWARESTAPAQGNQSLSRELRASALCPGLEDVIESPGKNAGVGYHFLLQGDLPDPGIEPRVPPPELQDLFPIWNQSVVPCPVLTVAS